MTTKHARRSRRSAQIISGLIRMAGSEPAPQGMVKDPAQELSDEGRFRLLEETFDDLSKALGVFWR